MGKYTELYKKMKDSTESYGESSSKGGFLKKLNWYKPIAALKNTDKDSVMVRVLPIEGKNEWHIPILKHSFKIGASWKNGLCLESESLEGKKFAKCPICEFLRENKEKIKGSEGEKALRPKMNICTLIYDYQDKEIKRLDFNYYDTTAILSAIVANESEDFESIIDTEGFNLHFGKDAETGWPRIIGVNEAKKSIDELKESLGIDALPDLAKYAYPSIEPTYKNLMSLLDIALDGGMFPEIQTKGAKSSSKKAMFDDDDDGMLVKKRPSVVEEDETDEEEIVVSSTVEDDEEEESPKPKAKATKKKVEEESDEEEAPVKKKAKSEEVAPKKTTMVSEEELDNLLDDLDV